jgi:CDP-paratose 2-epimerase
MRVLITGGAGFVGAHLGTALRESEGWEVVAFDNLRRRGSELNLARLRSVGIEVVHGDVRIASDFEDLRGDFELIVDAAAEPSVSAGLSGSPKYVFQTNFGGTLNALELARVRGSAFLLLSTSRVYSIPALKALRLVEMADRFVLSEDSGVDGASTAGVSETFPVGPVCSLYGASKLSAEMAVLEYAAAYGLNAIINRCGVIAGPGQFGRADQGVFTMWVLHHYFRKSLQYTGFGGQGKQVRDLLHPADLYALIRKQVARISEFSGQIFNAGGGLTVSTSLRELTRLCRERLGEVPVSSVLETPWVDVPFYVSDCTRARDVFDWMPNRSLPRIVDDTIEWIQKNESALRELVLSQTGVG